MTAIVIGLGNRDRGDDAVGLVVADRLSGRQAVADTRAWEGADVDLLRIWQGYEQVILVDAAAAEAAPGTIRRLAREDLGTGTWPVRATHAFGLPAVIELANRLDMVPTRLEIWTIEAAQVGVGDTMTPAVAAAAERLTAELARRLAAAA